MDFCNNKRWRQRSNDAIIRPTAYKYIELRELFLFGDELSEAFEKSYVRFYVMRYVSPKFRELYFGIMSELKRDREKYEIEDLLLKLVDDKRVMFSFATKMLNLSNGISPLFDSNVTKALKLTLDVFKKDESPYLSWYNVVEQIYVKLIEKYSKQINDFRDDIYCEINDKDNLLSDQRIIDMFLWRIGQFADNK